MRKPARLFSALGLCAALLLGVTVASTTPAAADTSPWASACSNDEGNLSWTAGPAERFGAAAVCIAALIDEAKRDNAARNVFVQGATQHLNTIFAGKYNFMLFNTGGSSGDYPGVTYTQNLSGVVAKIPIVFQGNGDAGYTLWIFSGGGTLTNTGDGGWLNWGYGGAYTTSTHARSWWCGRMLCHHDDVTVSFSARPQTPGQVIKSGVNANECIDNWGSASGNGNPIDLYPCNGGYQSQQWMFMSAGMLESGDSPNDPSGLLTINGKCLDVPGSSTSVGTQVQLWDCASTRWILPMTNDGQLWRYNAGTGTWQNVHSGLCLDLVGRNTAPATRLDLQPCSGSYSQKWRWASA